MAFNECLPSLHLLLHPRSPILARRRSSLFPYFIHIALDPSTVCFRFFSHPLMIGYMSGTRRVSSFVDSPFCWSHIRPSPIYVLKYIYFYNFPQHYNIAKMLFNNKYAAVTFIGSILYMHRLTECLVDWSVAYVFVPCRSAVSRIWWQNTYCTNTLLENCSHPHHSSSSD